MKHDSGFINTNKIIPSSCISNIIERALEDQTPPQDQNLLELFNEFGQYLDAGTSVDSKKIEILLESTFRQTKESIRSLEEKDSQFDLSALAIKSSFHRDLKKKVKNPDTIQSAIKLMQDYLIYIDNLSRLSIRQRHDALSSFPPANSAFYLCLGGTEGRFNDVKIGLKLSGADRLLYGIHSAIINASTPKLARHVSINIESHIPFAILNILGANKEVVAKRDPHHLSPLTEIPAFDALEFLDDYERGLNNEVENIIAALLRTENSLEYIRELGQLLKPYGINIDPTDNNKAPWYNLNDDCTEVESWTKQKDIFLDALRKLQTSEPSLPIKVDLYDPTLPNKLINDLLSSDKKQCVAAINILYFLMESFPGGGSYQFLKVLFGNLDPAINSPKVIEHFESLKIKHDLDKPAQQKLDKIIDVIKYEVQKVPENSLSYILSRNMPFPQLKEKLEKILEEKTEISQGTYIEYAVKALISSPNRREILQLLARLQDKTIIQEALKYSVKNSYPEFIKDLVEFGADVNRGEIENGYTLLHIAASNGYIEAMKKLLALGADVNEANNIEKMTPLHIAVEADNAEAIRLLLAFEADINKKDKDEKTAFDCALLADRVVAIRVLLGSKKIDIDINKVDRIGFTPIHIATNHNCVEAMRLLLEHGADVNLSYYGNAPLYTAVKKGYVEAIKLLLEYKADVHKVGEYKNTPLEIAIRQGNIEATKILLEYGANIDGNNKEKIFSDAILKNNIKAIRVLLGCGVDVNKAWKNEVTPIIYAIDCNTNIDTIKELLELGADVNKVTAKGITPLHIAASQGYVKAINILLEHGANIEADNDGFTPLHLAARGIAAARGYALPDHIEAIKVFLKVGINVNEANKAGASPLHIAVQESNIETIKTLLESGADVNQQNYNGSQSHNLIPQDNVGGQEECLDLVKTRKYCNY